MAQTNSVTIQASGSLRQHIGAETRVHNVRTVGEAVSQLKLPEVGELLFIVNGRLAYWQTELEDGDVLQLAPAVGGG
jgi:molybdopterin converting factor small subunit